MFPCSAFLAFSTKLITIIILVSLFASLIKETKEDFQKVKDGRKPGGDKFEVDSYLFPNGLIAGLMIAYMINEFLDICNGIMFDQITKSGLIMDWIFIVFIATCVTYYCVTEKRWPISIQFEIDFGNGKSKPEEKTPEPVDDVKDGQQPTATA